MNPRADSERQRNENNLVVSIKHMDQFSGWHKHMA
jgi:hypothetical protein